MYSEHVKKEIDNKLNELGIVKGTEFKAKNKVNGEFKYKYVGYGDLENICFSIHLKSLDNENDYIEVEPLWFDNRIITII